MNSITLTGYVGKDSELKEFNGTSLLKFSLGVEPNYKKVAMTTIPDGLILIYGGNTAKQWQNILKKALRFWYKVK